MICFNGLHKSMIASQERALEACQNMAIAQEKYVEHLEKRLEESEKERKQLTDKLLQLSGCMPVFQPAPQTFQRQSSEPVSGLHGDIQSYVQAAEAEEAKLYAAMYRKEAEDMMKEPITEDSEYV